jgi:RNA polymerase sigma-B factor
VSEDDRPASDADRAIELFRRLPDPAVREQLVERFLPLARHLARRFARRGESVEDLTQVADLGLLNAIDRFDPDRGVQFTTFAAVTITGELKRHFRDRGWSVRVPRSLQESALLVHRTLETLWQDLGRSPTVSEIAKGADLSEEAVIEAMDAIQAYSPASLDAVVSEDGTPMSETMGHTDPSFEVAEGWASVAPALEKLPDRERRILYLRFFKGMTQTEIAQEIGISQMHISRLIAQSLERVRREIRGSEARERGASEPEGDRR